MPQSGGFNIQRVESLLLLEMDALFTAVCIAMRCRCAHVYIWRQSTKDPSARSTGALLSNECGHGVPTGVWGLHVQDAAVSRTVAVLSDKVEVIGDRCPKKNVR